MLLLSPSVFVTVSGSSQPLCAGVFVSLLPPRPAPSDPRPVYLSHIRDIFV